MGTASVQAVAIRVATLDAAGVPQATYMSDALIKLEASPVYAQGAEVVYADASGSLCLNYRQPDRLRRYDLTLEICTLDAVLESRLVGALEFLSGGLPVGGAAVAAGTVGAPFGVSVELWSRHILNGDLDPVWPYVHWAIPRSYWTAGNVAFDGSNMVRPFQGYTDENPNWLSGPTGDWQFDSTRSIAWQLSTSAAGVTVPGSGGGGGVVGGFSGYPGEAVYPSETLYPTGG